MADAGLNDSTSASVMQRLYAVEAERDCRELLACYGFFADYGLNKEWVDLYTEDGVMEFSFYDDTQYYDNSLWPGVEDPRTVEFPLTSYRFDGTEELYACITAPRHERIMGRAQHQVGGQPSVFRLVGEDNAFIISTSIIYARAENNYSPTIQYQHHCLNRWEFRRVEGRWLISKNIRRTMGDKTGVDLLAGI
jgi:hypothetical protein